MTTNQDLIAIGKEKFIEHEKANIKERIAEKLRFQARLFCNSNVDDLPVNYMIDYITGKDDTVGITDAKLNRAIVECFKNDNNKLWGNETYQSVLEMICSSFSCELRRCFGKDLHELMLVQVPCSDGIRDSLRWCSALDYICKVLSSYGKSYRIMNGYSSVIATIQDTICHHILNDLPITDYVFDEDMVKGKMVVLVDDVCRSGNHIRKVRSELERLGAHVIACFVIGKTQA